ncbi:hypothetical protein F7D14_04625 [Methylocystis parvus]|uniref:Sulfur globule protein n=1 Tax=Methylocystis parvus TaxID=134 RepID=A0A6B8MA94_9HYPH|nr:hypothetical protein F7D14_04625 [Methylocystis parvus]
MAAIASALAFPTASFAHGWGGHGGWHGGHGWHGNWHGPHWGWGGGRWWSGSWYPYGGSCWRSGYAGWVWVCG